MKRKVGDLDDPSAAYVHYLLEPVAGSVGGYTGSDRIGMGCDREDACIVPRRPKETEIGPGRDEDDAVGAERHEQQTLLLQDGQDHNEMQSTASNKHNVIQTRRRCGMRPHFVGKPRPTGSSRMCGPARLAP